MGTNVRPEELNYHNYETRQYDKDIELVIPGHSEMHCVIRKLVNGLPSRFKILELGVGTGLTGEIILEKLNRPSYFGIDFSKNQLLGASRRLKMYGPTLICEDYSKVKFPGKFDLIVSVISIHHQTDQGKRKLFRKIFKSLNPGGAFIFGDLFTYKDRFEAALNEARHYHHIVSNSRNEKSLGEWAYHHKFLNLLAPLEDQVDWLKQAGFMKIKVLYKKYNTVLLVASKD